MKYFIPLSLSLSLFCTSHSKMVSSPLSGACITPLDISHRPVLILPDGQIFYLDSLREGVFLNAYGWKIIKEDSNHIAYYKDEFSISKDHGFYSKYHTIIIPNGQTWFITLLPWAKAEIFGGTTLSFLPDHSGTNKRPDLKLNGEALLQTAGELSLTTPKGIIGHGINYQTETGFGPYLDNLRMIQVHDLSTEPNISIKVYHSTVIASFGKTKKRTIVRGMEATLRPDADSFTVTPFELPQKLPYPNVDVFEFSNKTAPEILRKFVKWYGLNGYRCINGIDTNRLEVLGGGEGDGATAGMKFWVRTFETDSVHLRVEHDTLILSKTPFPAAVDQ
jgi:hypothetical protein